MTFGLSPFDIEGRRLVDGGGRRCTADAALCLVAILKGKLVTGVVGVFVPPVALVGAMRLAKPRSWWARGRFDGDAPATRAAGAGAPSQARGPAHAGARPGDRRTRLAVGARGAPQLLDG